MSFRLKARSILRSPRWHSSTISVLNSGVNDGRGRGFFLFHGLHFGPPFWGRGAAGAVELPVSTGSPGVRRIVNRADTGLGISGVLTMSNLLSGQHHAIADRNSPSVRRAISLNSSPLVVSLQRS